MWTTAKKVYGLLHHLASHAVSAENSIERNSATHVFYSLSEKKNKFPSHFNEIHRAAFFMLVKGINYTSIFIANKCFFLSGWRVSTEQESASCFTKYNFDEVKRGLAR